MPKVKEVDKELGDLQLEIKELKKQINVMNKKLTPSGISKLVDSSLLSVNNVKLLLQIVALIATLVMIFFAAIGFLGISSINNIIKTSDNVSSIEKAIDEKVSTIDSSMVFLNTFINDKKTDVNAKFEEYEKNINDRMNRSDKKVSDVQLKLTDMSKIFNEIGTNNAGELGLREQKLLVLLAKECDPDNPLWIYNSAILSAKSRNYTEAERLFSKYVEKMSNNKSKKINEDIEDFDRLIRYQTLSKVYLDDVISDTTNTKQLIRNILSFLYRSGYIRSEELVHIIYENE